MMAALFDADFNIVHTLRKKTRASEGPDAILARIIEVIETVIKEGLSADGFITGIGIGTPGTIDLDAGEILEAPNLGWKNVKLKSLLEKTFQCPVTILNDVDAGLYGEYRFGAAKGVRCAVGIFPGTGIGGACVYNGKLLRGRRGSCMEIGHTQVLPNGPVCGCGKQGCLEIVASRLAISAAAAQAAVRGQAPHLYQNNGTDLTNIRSGALAEAIAAGDTTVEAILREGARWLGIGAANIVNLLLPDVIVLGGGLVEAMPELYVKEVSETARDRVMPGFRDTFKVVSASLGDDAGIRGAAAYANTTETCNLNREG